MSGPSARRPTSGRRLAHPEPTAGAPAGATAGRARSGQGRTGQGRTDQGRSGRGRTDQGRTDEGGSGRGRTGQAGAGRGGTSQAGAGRGGSGQAGAGRGEAAGRAGTERAWRGRAGRADGTSSAPQRPVSTHYRRRRRAAVVVAGLGLLVGLVAGGRVVLYDTGLTEVEGVAVHGLATVPESAVRDAAAVAPGGPLIAVDTDGVARRVAAVEGVASVHVRRAWPDTVEVNVVERVPVALAQTPAGLVEVDATGLPYRRAPDPPPALPRLTFTGVAPHDPATTAAMTVLDGLTEPLRGQVATVDVTGTQVTLGLSDRRSVRWGDPERSAEKLAVLGPLLGRPGTVYDVSSPDLPTVRP